jgi:hypothetical protein
MNPTPKPTQEKAAALLRRSIVWDNHGCMPVARPHDTSFLPQLQRYRAAGMTAVMLNVGFGDMGIEEHVRTLASLRHWIRSRPEDYILLSTADDVEQAHASGRLAVGFDIEGGGRPTQPGVSLLRPGRALDAAGLQQQQPCRWGLPGRRHWFDGLWP